MRRLGYVLGFLITTMLSSSAQRSVELSAINAKYQGEVGLGYSIGVGLYSANRVSVQTIQGITLTEYFSAGIGVGADYYHDLSNSGELYVPVFVDMKGYLPLAANVVPLISLDLGYGIGATSGVSGEGGFLWSISGGIRYNKFIYQIGYSSQAIAAYGVSMGACQFKVGMLF